MWRRLWLLDCQSADGPSRTPGGWPQTHWAPLDEDRLGGCQACPCRTARFGAMLRRLLPALDQSSPASAVQGITHIWASAQPLEHVTLDAIYVLHCGELSRMTAMNFGRRAALHKGQVGNNPFIAIIAQHGEYGLPELLCDYLVRQSVVGPFRYLGL